MGCALAVACTRRALSETSPPPHTGERQPEPLPRHQPNHFPGLPDCRSRPWQPSRSLWHRSAPLCARSFPPLSHLASSRCAAGHQGWPEGQPGALRRRLRRARPRRRPRRSSCRGRRRRRRRCGRRARATAWPVGWSRVTSGPGGGGEGGRASGALLPDATRVPPSTEHACSTSCCQTSHTLMSNPHLPCTCDVCPEVRGPA